MRWLRKSTGDSLAVSMSGIKLGDRLLVIGTSDTALIAALATKSGLTGRACMVDPAEDGRARAAVAVEQEGALVESFAAPTTALPFDPNTFDVVVMRNVLPGISPDDRRRTVEEARRVLRPGGRCIAIDDQRRGGIAALFGGGAAAPDAEGLAPRLLTEAGFRGVRTLAARDGLIFVEGVRPGTGEAAD